MVAQSSSNLVW